HSARDPTRTTTNQIRSMTTMTTPRGTNYSVDEIGQLFPSLMKIKDQSLRERVAAVWNEAINTGCGGKGWTFDELRACKFTLLADVGKPLEYDKDASGKVIQGTFGQQVRHPFTGVALAYKHGIPGEVMHIIATHSHEGDKMERSIESIIFHHADFVDFDIAKLLGMRATKKL